MYRLPYSSHFINSSLPTSRLKSALVRTHLTLWWLAGLTWYRFGFLHSSDSVRWEISKTCGMSANIFMWKSPIRKRTKFHIHSKLYPYGIHYHYTTYSRVYHCSTSQASLSVFISCSLMYALEHHLSSWTKSFHFRFLCSFFLMSACLCVCVPVFGGVVYFVDVIWLLCDISIGCYRLDFDSLPLFRITIRRLCTSFSWLLFCINVWRLPSHEIIN